ncbi:MAG: hypothetical protein R3Y44_06115 [Rikenellaceae bacterium]
MRRLALLILLITPLVASAQRMEVYTYNSFNFLSLYSYGLQRSVVKTNAEMRASQMNGDGTGVTKRHHTTKGVDERIGDAGYNANEKITFAFIASPYNVDINGQHTSSTSDVMSWSEASGWDTSIDVGAGEYYDITTGVGVGVSTLAETPTGCAAYRGMNGTDKEGEWRLPTQREMQVMFTVIEQALGYIQSGEVESEVLDGIYWTSTEFYASGAPGYGWSISTITGFPLYELKTERRMVRCIKDIYETINEQ